jgi:hypothetical protein
VPQKRYAKSKPQRRFSPVVRFGPRRSKQSSDISLATMPIQFVKNCQQTVVISADEFHRAGQGPRRGVHVARRRPPRRAQGLQKLTGRWECSFARGKFGAPLSEKFRKIAHWFRPAAHWFRAGDSSWSPNVRCPSTCQKLKPRTSVPPPRRINKINQQQMQIVFKSLQIPRGAC